MKQFRLSLIVALLTAVGVACGAAAGFAADLAGDPAPDFVLKSVTGENYRLSEYRGRVVVVSFWASWCGDCRSQLEALSGLYERFSGTGLEMLAVSMDRSLDQAADSARSIGVAFPALHDAGGAVGELYDVARMPYVVVIDQYGVVRGEFTGFDRGDEDDYLEHVRSLLD